MTWPATTHPALALLRTQLVACAAAISSGLVLARWHYPTANPSAVRGAGDPLPLGVIETFNTRRVPWLDSTGGLLAGSATVTLYADAATLDAAGQEKLADDLIDQLASQESGLIWGELERGEASEPDGEQQAADGPAVTNYRTITLTLPFGLTPA